MRDMRAGARGPKECSGTGALAPIEVVEPLGHRHVARGVRFGAAPAAASSSGPLPRRPRTRPGRDSVLDRSRPPPPSRHRPRAAPRRRRSAAAVVFFRRFLPPRLPRLVFFFTAGDASPSALASAPSPRSPPRMCPLRARLSSSETASWITSGDGGAASGSTGTWMRGVRRRFDAGAGFSARPQRHRWPARPRPRGPRVLGLRLAVGSGGCVSVGRRVGRARGRLLPPAAAARAAAGALLRRCGRPVGHRLAFLGPPRLPRPRHRPHRPDPTPRLDVGVGVPSASAASVGASVRQASRLPPGWRAGRLLGLALERDRVIARLGGRDERRERLPVQYAPDRHLRLLPDELGGVGDEHLDPVHLPDGGGGVVAAQLAELQLHGRALGDRRLGLQVDELALGLHLEVVRMGMTLHGHEEEPSLCRLLDCSEPCASGPGHELEHARVQLDAIGLDAVPGDASARSSAQPASRSCGRRRRSRRRRTSGTCA